MKVSINFPDDIEVSLRRHAAAVGQDVETFVQKLVVENLEASEPPPLNTSPSEFARRLDAWIALHPVLNHAVDDSRESIYSDRG